MVYAVAPARKELPLPGTHTRLGHTLADSESDTHRYTQADTDTHRQTDRCTRAHTRMHAHMHTHACMHICTHSHTHTCKHTHTQAYTLPKRAVPDGRFYITLHVYKLYTYLIVEIVTYEKQNNKKCSNCMAVTPKLDSW